MRNIRIAAYVAAAAAALAGSLALTAPAHAASISCTSSVDKPTSNGAHFAAIPSVNGSLNCVLGYGNQSGAVTALQLTLNRCFGAGLTVDGIFGVNTRAAVETAQGIVGVKTDGVYGPNTRNAFNTHHRWRTADDAGKTYCEAVVL